jgi:hypothetical protein
MLTAVSRDVNQMGRKSTEPGWRAGWGRTLRQTHFFVSSLELQWARSELVYGVNEVRVDVFTRARAKFRQRTPAVG